MKRWSIILAVSVLVLTLSGCKVEKKPESGINVYYLNAAGDGLTYENIDVSMEYSEETIDMIMDKLIKPDENEVSEGASSVLMNGITVDSYSYDAGTQELIIDLAGDYGSLDNADKLLLTAGLTLSFEQIDAISDVRITIHGESLLDSNGNDVGRLNEEDFVIHSGNEINNYTNTRMTLYFLNSRGTQLVQESRNVYYNSNVPLEQVVLEELIKGAQEANHQSALAGNVDFLSVTIQENICYVNFDESVVQTMASYNCELALESIVQSIHAVCGIDRVQFSVNGDLNVEFPDGTSIAHIFTAD